MKRISALSSLLALTAIVTACGGILTSDQPVKQIYVLEPWSVPSGDFAGDSWPTLALTVTAVPGLDTDHIQAVGTDARMHQYANARWADFLPDVLTSVMRRSLSSADRFTAVKASPAPDTDDWVLALEAQQFYGVRDGAGNTSSVEVRFEGTLNCGDKGHQLRLSSSSPVYEERLSVVVRAHQKALDAVTRDLLDQIEASCQ
jgi:ABC-type uncharacterized transport system auxiliary subunit